MGIELLCREREGGVSSWHSWPFHEPFYYSGVKGRQGQIPIARWLRLNRQSSHPACVSMAMSRTKTPTF